MNVSRLALPDVLLLQPRSFSDERGFFFESFSEHRYSEAGINARFVQDNVSFSKRHVLRGLHYQWPHNQQGKLVSVLQGTVWDVAVDLRQRSSTYGRWVAAELSMENRSQLWIPPGFAHGFIVLSETALFHYKCTAPYSPADEQSLRWNDPHIGITWPIDDPVLSARDAEAPVLSDIPTRNIP